MPKLFISFKSSDFQQVRKFFYALKYQGFDLWDYSQAGDEIPVGAVISDYLKRKIIQSDYVVVLISRESSSGYYTRLEVEFIKELKKQVIPVLIDPYSEIDWNGPYDFLRDKLFLDINMHSLNEIIRRICGITDQTYISPLMEYERLPVMQKLSQELAPFEKVNNAAYRNLFELAEDISKTYNNEDFIATKDYLTCFSIYCTKYQIDIYYLIILKGVIEMHLGFWGEAEEFFRKAIQHPKSDSNAYSALGHLYLKQERFDESLEMFEKAYQICEDRYKSMMKFNIEICHFKLNKEIHETGFFDTINYSSLIDDDYLRIMSFKANILYQKNLKAQAFAIWEELDKKGVHDSDSVYFHAMGLIQEHKPEQGIDLLERYAHKLKNKNLYRHLIRQYFNYSHLYLEKALNMIETLINENPYERSYYFELIRGLIAAGKRDKARNLCNTLLQKPALPKTDEDFFIDGFANYVLKREERAMYDYQRAKTNLPYYDNYLPENFINT